MFANTKSTQQRYGTRDLSRKAGRADDAILEERYAKDSVNQNLTKTTPRADLPQHL